MKSGIYYVNRDASKVFEFFDDTDADVSDTEEGAVLVMLERAKTNLESLPEGVRMLSDGLCEERPAANELGQPCGLYYVSPAGRVWRLDETVPDLDATEMAFALSDVRRALAMAAGLL